MVGFSLVRRTDAAYQKNMESTNPKYLIAIKRLKRWGHILMCGQKHVFLECSRTSYYPSKISQSRQKLLLMLDQMDIATGVGKTNENSSGSDFVETRARGRDRLKPRD